MLLRIGEKLINRQKIHQAVDAMLELRSRGGSQMDVARKFGVDRTMISRIESLGEIRKGGKIALIGFPIANCAELSEIAKQEGVDYCLLLSEEERWNFVRDKTGVELFNQIMEIIASIRSYDIVIILGSNMRIKLVQTLLDKEVISVQIGESPIAENKYVNPDDIWNLLKQLNVGRRLL